MILNVGCGGRIFDKDSLDGDIRLDIKTFSSVNLVGDAHKLPISDNCIDRILCFEVLEHLDSPIKVMKEFVRVLKKDGKIEVSIPNVWYWAIIVKCWISFYLHSFRENVSIGCDHKQGWDIYEFERLAYQVGLSIQECKWVDRYPEFVKGRFFSNFFPRHLKHTHVMFMLERI